MSNSVCLNLLPYRLPFQVNGITVLPVIRACPSLPLASTQHLNTSLHHLLTFSGFLPQYLARSTCSDPHCLISDPGPTLCFPFPFTLSNWTPRCPPASLAHVSFSTFGSSCSSPWNTLPQIPRRVHFPQCKRECVHA